MTEETGPRKLAAIMSIDLAGYSAATEADEAEAVALVTRLRAEVHQVATLEGGRIFNSAGDGFMLEFASATGALAAAETLGRGVKRGLLRIGVHVGDVLVGPTGDLLGHSVNVAARLQQLAQPGAVFVSLDAQRAVRGKLAQRLHAAGSVQLDKMSEAIEVFTLEVETHAPTRAKRSLPVLAVLPFDNDSSDAEMEYFSDGVADEIILTLLRQSDLSVIGRTSAFQFRGKRKTQAAAALRATHVLDGSVRCSGTKLRVNVQLAEAKSGIALWSEHYDGERIDAFALEEAIAAKVVASLKRSLIHPERAQLPIEPAAHDLYLRARQTWLMLSDVEEDQAAVLLEHCVALAPDFAPGWAMLASVHALRLPRDRDRIGEPQHDAASLAAKRALDLDPDCATALAAQSLLKPAFADHAEKLRLVNDALKPTPKDASLHLARAAWLYSVGRINHASGALATAARLDPLGPVVDGLRASLLVARGETAAAVEIAGAVWARWPDSAFAWYMMWVTLWASHRFEEAETLLAPGAPPKRGVADRDVAELRNHIDFARMSETARRTACEDMLDTLARSREPLPISTWMMAAGFGCAELAFDVMDQALDQGRALRPDPFDGFGMARAQASLQFFVGNGGEPIWRHRRFAGLSARLGLAQYWMQSGKWPDCAADVEYDFKVACAEAAARRSTTG